MAKSMGHCHWPKPEFHKHPCGQKGVSCDCKLLQHQRVKDHSPRKEVLSRQNDRSPQQVIIPTLSMRKLRSATCLSTDLVRGRARSSQTSMMHTRGPRKSYHSLPSVVFIMAASAPNCWANLTLALLEETSSHLQSREPHNHTTHVIEQAYLGLLQLVMKIGNFSPNTGAPIEKRPSIGATCAGKRRMHNRTGMQGHVKQESGQQIKDDTDLDSWVSRLLIQEKRKGVKRLGERERG